MHDLVFLTNNDLGFVKMKEAMWRADESGAFRFGDADQGQLNLVFETHEERLWRRLMEQFAGQRVQGSVVQRFVDLQTLYLKKHKTSTLKLHEADTVPTSQRIRVSGRAKPGQKAYPDTVRITFPPKAP